MKKRLIIEPRREKTSLQGFRPRPTQSDKYAATEEGWKIEILDLTRGEIDYDYYTYRETKGVDQLCSYRIAVLRLWFHIGKTGGKLYFFS